jgi:hypothetical protein
VKTELPPDYMLAKLQMVMPLFQEARDALVALSVAQCKLHGIDLSLGDRMDQAGTYSLDDWNAERTAAGVAPTVEEQPPTGRHPKCGHPNCNCFEGCVMRMRDEERAAAGVGVVATTERVEVGRLVLPAFDGDEYGEPKRGFSYAEAIAYVGVKRRTFDERGGRTWWPSRRAAT